MMEEYQLSLKNSRLKLYNAFAWISIFFINIVLIALTFTDAYNKFRFGPIATFGTLLFLLLIGRGDKYNPSDRRKYISIGYTLVGIAATTMKLYWAFAIVLLFILLYVLSTRKFQVTVSKKKIQFPFFPAKNISWNDLNNILIKNDILTIDFKNNKLIQAELESEDFFNEKEFNDFCRQQLNK